MPNRTTKVTLVAEVNNYIAGMQKAANETKTLGTSAEKLAQQKQGFTTLGVAALAVGAVAAAGVGLAVAKFAEFDAQMSNVQAATHESVSNMNLLREAAIKAGADTVFSATEAAQAEEELAKAGVSVTDILSGGLSGALDLASAGQLEVGRSAEIAATAMTQFGLKGAQVPHIADLLAAGAGKAQGSVEDLSQALNQGGLVASQTGLTIEETTGTLSAFAAAGLLGSDAGTAFKTMLQRLTPQSAAAQTEMDKLGISAYDAQGDFIGMTEFAGVLHDGLKDLTVEQRNAALSVIFGSDSVRAASVIYNQGADGIQSWIDKTNDSGYAAETAALKLDNLQGDIEQLSGSFDTALIQSGSGANDALRGLVETVTNVVNGFNALPGPMQSAVLIAGTVTAGIALLGGAALIAVPKIAEFKLALQSLDVTGRGVGKVLGRGGLVAAGLAAVAGAMASYSSSATLAADQTARLNAITKTGALGDLDKEFSDSTGSATSFGNAMNSLFSSNFFESYAGGPQQLNGAIKGLSLGMIDLGAYADTNKAKFAQLGEQLAETARTDFKSASSAFQEYVAMSVKSGRSQEEAINQALNAFPAYKAALIDLAGEQGTNISQQDLQNLAMNKGAVAAQLMRDENARVSGGLSDVSAGAQDAEGKVNDLADAIRNFASGQFDMNAAQRDFEQAVDDANESLEAQKAAYQEANGTLDGFVASLDISTQSGRDNQAALDQIAASANASAAAILTQTGSVDQSTAALDLGKDALYRQLEAYGVTGAAADVYVASVLATPKDVATEVALNGVDTAEARLATYKANLEAIPKSAYTVMTVDQVINYAPGVIRTPEAPNAVGNMYVGGVRQSFANGGMASGIYQAGNRPLYKFAEPETGWEAFISGKPGQEGRNAAIAMNALGRLGYGGSPSGSARIPQVSLAGATLLMSVDGRQMTAVIQEQIVSAGADRDRTVSAAYRIDPL